MAVKIVTDSTCDLPRELVAQHDVTVVPLRVSWDNQTFRDGIDFTPAEFFARLEKSESLPKTSQPSVGDFADVYRTLVRAGHSVVSIHVSSKLSGTCDCARAASAMVDGEIHVVDSENVSLGLGFQALEAARAAISGSVDEVMKVVSSVKRSVRLVCCLRTLEYLRKGGRIGELAAFLGSLLSVKPLIGVEKGYLVSTDKARGFRQAMTRMVDGVVAGVPKGARVVAGVMHAAARDTADWLQAEVYNRLRPVEVHVIETGAVVGTYAGPGAVGVTVYQR
ncbi:MAG: DegV family protein [Ignavibacteriales bacterium]